MEKFFENIDSSLTTLEEEQVPYFSFAGKTFLAKPCHFYDADTFSGMFPYRGENIKYRCRCLGYDSAEMKPLKSNPKRKREKELALAARERFVALVTAHPSGLCVLECGDFDKYGRILVTVYNGVNDKSVNDIMIEEGFAKVYDGGKKEAW